MLPKGNLIAGLADYAAAAQEAEEEAGIRGAVRSDPVGTYGYAKLRADGSDEAVTVDVYAMSVTEELSSWKEQHERERRWFPVEEAATLVDEPDLQALLARFDP